MALWGGRFSGETRGEVTKFSESISFDQRLYKHDIAGSIAHVTMLAKQGIIPESSAEAIRVELKNILGRIEAGDFKYDITYNDKKLTVPTTIDKLA